MKTIPSIAAMKNVTRNRKIRSLTRHHTETDLTARLEWIKTFRSAYLETMTTSGTETQTIESAAADRAAVLDGDMAEAKEWFSDLMDTIDGLDDRHTQKRVSQGLRDELRLNADFIGGWEDWVSDVWTVQGKILNNNKNNHNNFR